MFDLVNGWQKACDVCKVSWGGGETPALAGVVEAGRIDLAASSVGIIPSRDRLTLGDKLADGDAIVLLASSGIHANGVSLARKLAERLPDGYASKLSDGRLYGEAVLDPTTLYVPGDGSLVCCRHRAALLRETSPAMAGARSCVIRVTSLIAFTPCRACRRCCPSSSTTQVSTIVRLTVASTWAQALRSTWQPIRLNKWRVFPMSWAFRLGWRAVLKPGRNRW